MPAPTATHPGRCARVLIANEHAPHAARSFVRRVFGDADDLLMVTDELVSNAVEHTPGPVIEVFLSRTADGVLVEVSDSSRIPPAPRDAGDFEDSGRGLAIVDALSVRWGWRPSSRGKTVYAVLEAQS